MTALKQLRTLQPLCWQFSIMRYCPLALLTISFAAGAQSVPSAKKLDPLDARAAVPPLRYESTLKPAARAQDDNSPSWREANDTAARIGGWRAYAREAQQPTPAAKEPPR